jgi:hypothetical protein
MDLPNEVLNVHEIVTYTSFFLTKALLNLDTMLGRIRARKYAMSLEKIFNMFWMKFKDVQIGNNINCAIAVYI